jgi:uncharacterized protein (DUF305 family)
MHHGSKHDGHGGNKHYLLLGVMAVLSFGAMYALMYAMVDRFDNVYSNWNQVYMAGLMTAPMVLIELFLMRFMYPNKKLNAIVASGFFAVGVGCWLMVRNQAAIGDRQFLNSMIPHHGAALLMCEEADLEDPEIKRLCESIRAGQQAEIDQMKAILLRLGR